MMWQPLLTIIRKDFRELGLPMAPLGLLCLSGNLALGLIGTSVDALVQGMTASLCLLAGVALPALSIFREKTCGTWEWLRLLSPHPRLLTLAKLLVFLGFYACFCLTLLPLWLLNPSGSETGLQPVLWLVLAVSGWIVGCLVFVLVIAVTRAFLAVMLGLCGIQMCASAVLVLGAASGTFAPGAILPFLPPPELTSAAAAATALIVGLLAVEAAARFTRDGA